jgi:hypothetical protein
MIIPISTKDKELSIILQKKIHIKKTLFDLKIKRLKKEFNNDLKDLNNELYLVQNKIKTQIENANNEKENLYLNDEINSLDL